ncbi:MAG: hypothetical protein HGB26_00515 [Desulfobulbaceae bacterium]|nr:hypothetical protein [Desulfobulbaceae bacterium]
MNKSKNKIGPAEAIIPIGIPDDGPSDNYLVFESSLEEFETVIFNNSLPTYKNKTKFHVRRLPAKESVVDLSEWFTGKIFSISVDEINEDFTFPLFIKRIHDLLMILSISRPGWFRFEKGIAKCKGKNGKEFSEILPMLMSDAHFAVISSKKLKWPKIINLDIEDTWNWYFMNHNSTDGVSKNSLGRALNSFSHLFHNDLIGLNPQDLFWSLLGVEALYLENKYGIQNEINRKTQLVLGDRDQFKKLFNEMYNYRSRFIHGELDFINLYNVEEDSSTIGNYVQELSKAKDLSISILIATFQKMVLNNWNSLDFDYKLMNT